MNKINKKVKKTNNYITNKIKNINNNNSNNTKKDILKSNILI